MPGCAAGVMEEKSISAKKGFLSRLAILYGMLNFASFAPGRYMTLIPKPILCTTPLESEFPSLLIFYKHLTTLWSGFRSADLGIKAKLERIADCNSIERNHEKLKYRFPI